MQIQNARRFRTAGKVAPCMAIGSVVLAAGGCRATATGSPDVSASSARASVSATPRADVDGARLDVQVLRPGAPVDAVRVGGTVVVAAEGSWRVGEPGGPAARVHRLAPPGSVFVDLLAVPGAIWAVLDPPELLRVEATAAADGGLALGSPESVPWPAGAEISSGRRDRLAAVGDRLVVLAANGAWSRPAFAAAGDGDRDWERILDAPEPAETIVPTARGPIVTAGRRAWTIDDARFAGSASRLVPAPPSVGWPAAFAALRRPSPGAPDGQAEILAMDGALREVDRERWRTRWSEAVIGLAFDRTGLIVETEAAIVRVGGIDLADSAIRPPVLGILGRWSRPPGTRLVSFGPARAAVLGADGRVHPVPGRADDLAPWIGTPPAGVPAGVSFDGRTVRLWPTGGGAVDVGIDGAVRAVRSRTGAGIPRFEPMARTISTARGTLRCVASDDAPGPAGRGPVVVGHGGVAAGGRAWVAGPSGLSVYDPATGQRLASAAIDGRILWMNPLSGGRGVVAATDRGTVLRASLRSLRTQVAGR